MPNRTASSPASPYVSSALRLRGGGRDRLAICPVFFPSWRNGLAGGGDNGDDLTKALARKLVSRGAEDASVEDIFQQAQQIAVRADQLLFNADCERTEPEPVLDAALPSGGEQAAAALVPRGGHHSGTGREQATLFSWAEFLTEPDEQPKRGARRRPDRRFSTGRWNASSRPDSPPPEAMRPAVGGRSSSI